MRYEEAYKQLPNGASPQREALDYVAFLAGQTGRDVNAIPLPDEIPTDLNEINRLVFESAEAQVNDDLDLDESIVQQINSVASQNRSNAISNAYDRYQDVMATINSHFIRVRGHLTDARNAYDDYMRAMGMQQNLHLKEQIERVHKETNFKFTEWDDSNRYMVFETRAPYVLSHRNDAAGIDVNVNMGTFLIRVYANNFSIRVHRLANNQSSREIENSESCHYHPHISRGGDVCWGDAHVRTTELSSKSNLYELMLMLHALLSSYDSSAPFMPLEYFDPNFDRSQLPSSVYLRGECDNCEAENESDSFTITRASVEQYNQRNSVDDVENEIDRESIRNNMIHDCGDCGYGIEPTIRLY